MLPPVKPIVAAAIFILIFSVGQTLFASILLVTSKRGNKVANRFLATFMLCLCITLSTYLLFDFWRLYFPHSALVYQPMLLILPPFLWFYLVSTTRPNLSIGFKDILLHLVPFAMVSAVLIPFFQLSGIEKMEWMYLSKGSYIELSGTQRWISSIITPLKVISICHGLLYCGFSFKELIDHKARVMQTFSFKKDVDLLWFTYLLSACTLAYLFVSISVLIAQFQIDSKTMWVVTFSAGGSLLSIFGYFGVKQESIDATLKMEALTENKKYRNSMLSQQHVIECHEELLIHMSKEKPYTNAQLTLNDLAKAMTLPARELSRVINECSGKNFMEFINGYRINEAKIILEQEQSPKVVDVSLLAGFNSKSAFYDAFKKHTGMTPLKYKQKMTISSTD